MNEQKGELHLGQITTLWSAVRAAHGDPKTDVMAARELLLERYGTAILRYLRGILRDADAADELYQEFALHFLRGDFRGANPESGRFRNYVKTSLFHLVERYRRKQKAKPGPLPDDLQESGESSFVGSPSEEAFHETWRKELLSRAWEQLACFQAETRRPFYSVLRFRVENPDMSAGEMAEQLSAQLGKPLTSASIRQTLHRAREQFSQLLLEAVSHSLDNPTQERLEEELVDLNLLRYCRPALERAQLA